MAKNPAPQVPQHQQDSTAAFLREVDEALQYEKLMSLWQRYKLIVVGAVLVALLTVVGAQGWHTWKLHQARAQATKWYEISAISAETTRQKLFAEFLTESSGGYRALAAFTQAETATDPQSRANAYLQVASDVTLPEWLTGLARFNAALAQLGTDDTAAKSNLELLSQQGDETSPIYPLALEQLAIMAQRKADVTAARGYTERLLAIQSPLPADLRQRALQRLGLLSTIPH